jgi:hypothetical protein
MMAMTSGEGVARDGSRAVERVVDLAVVATAERAAELRASREDGMRTRAFHRELDEC